MAIYDEVNHDKVRALEELLNGTNGIGWQHYNNILTDYEFVEAIRAVLGEKNVPESGSIDRCTGLLWH